MALTDEQIAAFKEAFSLFDKDADGKISTKELGTMMRSMGQAPSEQQIKEMVAEIDVDGTGEMTFQHFLTMMMRRMQERDSEDDLCEAFRVFDRENTGAMPLAELRHMLCNLGEKLSEDEAAEVLKDVSPDGEGNVKYGDFVRVLMSK